MYPDRETLDAIERLHNLPEFKMVRQWLVSTRDNETVIAIRAPADADVLRGRAQALHELVTIIESAPQTIERLEKRNGTQQNPKIR